MNSYSDEAKIKINDNTHLFFNFNLNDNSNFSRKDSLNELIDRVNLIKDKTSNFLQKIIDENKILYDRFTQNNKKKEEDGDDGMNVEDD